MSPSTPAYRAVPGSPPSTFSTPDTLVNPSPRSGPSHDDREKPHSRYPSASARMRVRPLPIILGILGFILLAGPILHPTPRNALHTYLHAQTAPPPYDGAQPPTGGLDPAVVPMTLEARLSYLMDRPALDHPMAELPSRYGCPSLTYNRDWYFFHNEKKGQWEHLTGGDVLRYRNKLVEYLRTVEREGGKLVWEDGMDSHVPSAQRRGLIFTAGDGPALERLKLTLHMLRNVVKSKIITHIYHFKGELEEPGLKDGFAEKYDVQFIEVGGRRQNGKSWNIKNIAFLNTQFTEFVYMDSDNIPLGDPLDLFDSVEYQQSGSVFWSDLNKDHPDNFIWRVLGRACSDIHWPAEAGQLIFDKRGNNGLNLAVLHLSAHMMAEEEMYGQLGYGDKDTFRYSFYMLGLDYQMAPRQFASAGGYQDDQGVSSEEFCGHTMLQWGLTPPSKRYDPSYHPRPMFLHTILAKHRYNLQPEKLFTHYKRPRLDGMTEPTLVRTYYEWTGSCFAIDLKGPDGAPGTKMGWGDGQGVELEPLAELIGDKFVYDELQGISRTFVNIAH